MGKKAELQERTCPSCEQVFYRKPFAKATYCSLRCSQAGRHRDLRETGTCPRCGVEFSFRKKRPKIHCSRKCANPETQRYPRDAPEGFKVCGKCGETKLLDAFYGAPKAADGKMLSCIPCSAEWNKRQRAMFPEKYALRSRRNRLKRYGLAQEEYEKLLAKQNGCCAICNIPETARNKKEGTVRMLSVDHCHATGKVRGLLCQRCNRTLGQMQDDIQLLQNAIDYVLLHQPNP